MSDTIYRAMGIVRCGEDHYVNGQACRRIYEPRLRRNRDGTYEGGCLRWEFPDPLTDWSAFGEIVEWAEGQGFAWTTSSGHNDHEGERHYAQVQAPAYGEGTSPDFRTAVLAALESAIGGEQ